MRKLFLLIPTLLLSMMMSATETTIGPDNPTETVNNQLISALGSATDGDVIILTAGIYNESSNYVVFNKNVEVRAAAGANPVVQVVTYLKVEGGKHAIINGLTFDGSAQGSRDQYFRFTDNGNNILEVKNCTFNDVKKNIFRCESGKKFALLDVQNCTFAGSLSNVMKLESNLCGAAHFDGCEFSNTADIVIHGTSASHLDECIVNGCYFHNNTKQSIYFEASGTEGTETCDELTVTNSTFANTTALTNWISVIDIRPYSATNTIKVTVDHCTFYNNPTVDSGHANIRTKDISDVTVSNSIFAHPEAYARRATYCIGGGNINNCLTYNFTSDGTKGHAYGCTVNAASAVGDPLFNDLANNRYTFAGDWVTMNISPARGAATDGSDLGDPRWYSAETLPSTDFASAYDLLGTKALLAGDIELDASNYIKYKGTSTPGIATWKLHITKACGISALVDIESGCTSGRQLTLTVKDAEGNTVAALAQASATYNDADINLGSLYIPAEGDYTLILTNSTANSGAVLEKITLSYVGGAVQNIAAAANTTVDVSEAWFSAGGTRADSKIDFPDSSIQDGWIRWNVHVAEGKYYNVTVNVVSSNGHNYTVSLVNTEHNLSLTEGGQTSAASPLDLDKLFIPAGDYVMEVTNSIQYSDAVFVSVEFAPASASALSLPCTLAFNDAVLSARAHVTDGKLYFAPIGDTNPVGEWASWAVTTDHDGLFLFTMGVNSDNEQSYKITILDDGDNVVDFCDLKTSTGAQTLKHYFQLATGDYSVKVENTKAWSHGYLTSFAVTEPGTAITMSEEATDNSAWSAKVNDGINYDVQIIRTLRAGMYNTFCLPFEVTSNEAKEIFGLDIEIYTLGSAVVTDNILYVTLDNASDIYPGTPVFIRPSRDIVNPIFDDVTFTANEPSSTTRVNANFAGTFVMSSLEPDLNILYLGTENTLYYPEVSTPIKGMRGWFVIHDAPSPAPAIRQMRIIEKVDSPTNINLLEDNGKAIKTITNGQLIIIRDGVRYNAMGTRIE